MSYRYRKYIYALIVTLCLSAGGSYLVSLSGNATSAWQFVAPVALGDDDDDDEGDDDGGGSAKTKTTYETRYVTRQVSKVMTVTPPEYRTDTDKDGLVDAIDPDPTTAQQEYFTDTDGDSVANAYDLHHDEDDFAYSEMNTDMDGNGIVDEYEGR